MDHIDYKIIGLLQDNARMSLAELGRTISMTQPAVTDRLRKLEDQGIITSYRAVVAPKKLGKHTTAFLLFKTKDCNEFVNFCKNIPEIVDMHRISGEYNYLMKVVTETMESLEQFIDSCSAYGFSTTLIVMSTTFEGKWQLDAAEKII